MTTITCKIPDGLDSELEAVAEKRKVSKSVVVREALEANLHAQRAAANLSAFDLMRDACGVVKGGPADRSTNKRHLKGYGRD
ncbi:MAG: ribbon-helix-helix protein, CopG family [Verrucomicrobia bacterium]|nr:ribbon-helix-helix protein, CopG family [Verrucomicrobiota bacterium]